MYNVSIAPHLRAKNSTKTIMRDVCIALTPIIAFGVYHFGLPALIVTILCVVSSVLFELLFELLTKKTITIFDNSALVTGLILAINLPANVPWYIPVIGSFFAIVIVKCLFGGIGQNFMNPALAARCFLLISFGSKMTNFAIYDVYNLKNSFSSTGLKTVLNMFLGKDISSVDAVAGSTPLVQLSNGDNLDLLSLFLGNHSGTIGEVSALAILIGAAYLLIKKVISIRIPFSYIISTITFIAIIQLIKGNSEIITVNYLVGELLSGGLLVGAFFMATDYVTSPITPSGQIIYGILLGFLTAMFRVIGSTAEGVSYAIIISNLLVPIIEKATVPMPFGSHRTKEVK